MELNVEGVFYLCEIVIIHPQGMGMFSINRIDPV
jgi:hypothetical protein